MNTAFGTRGCALLAAMSIADVIIGRGRRPCHLFEMSMKSTMRKALGQEGDS